MRWVPSASRGRGMAWAAAAAVLAMATPASAIVGGTPTTAFLPVGIGVQVTADWVLTVQHAAFNPGATYFNGYGNRTVAARYDAPGSGSFPANDLALLRLVPDAAAPAFAPLPVAADLFADGAFAVPWAATITSPLNSGPARGYGFTTISAFTTLLDPDGGGPLGPVTVNYLTNGDTAVIVQGGDSGGGLFLGHVVDAGSPLLALNSALLTDPAEQPIGSAFVLLAAYRTWIDQTLLSDTADAQAVNWVSAVPEPAAWTLWGLGLAALAGRAARRRAR